MTYKNDNMEEKAKSALKSALSFLEGDVVFYITEAEKHETGAKAKESIKHTKQVAENLIKRIRKQIKEDMPVEKNKCGKCAHVSYCTDTLKYIVPCVHFEKKKPDFGKEKDICGDCECYEILCTASAENIEKCKKSRKEKEREEKEQKRSIYCESCAYFPYCDSTYKESRNEEGCAYFEVRDSTLFKSTTNT